MAKRIIFCPKCMNMLHRKDEVCSRCGMKVGEMQDYIDEQKRKLKGEDKEIEEEQEIVNDGGIVVDTKKIMDLEDKKQDAMLRGENFEEKVEEQKTEPKRHKHKKKAKEDKPEYVVDENGEYEINTDDVTFLEGLDKQTPSIKKARGEYEPEKIKWWEIYKWADRMLAKRKIMKEVNKASKKVPKGISTGKMKVLTVLFGWLGLHNFYANNFIRGTIVVILDIIVGLVMNIDVLYQNVGIFLGGGSAFFVFAMWLLDLFRVFTNRYKYRISKEEFISNLNVETRAKLGNKYIKFDRVYFKAKEKERLDKIERKKNKKKWKRSKIN